MASLPAPPSLLPVPRAARPSRHPPAGPSSGVRCCPAAPCGGRWGPGRAAGQRRGREGWGPAGEARASPRAPLRGRLRHRPRVSPCRYRAMRSWGVIGGLAAAVAAGIYVLWGPIAERKKRRRGRERRGEAGEAVAEGRGPVWGSSGTPLSAFVVRSCWKWWAVTEVKVWAAVLAFKMSQVPICVEQRTFVPYVSY